MKMCLSKKVCEELRLLMKSKSSFEYYAGGDIKIMVNNRKITAWDLNNNKPVEIQNTPQND